MSRMAQYYASRVAVTAIVVVLLIVQGSPWWVVAAVGVVIFGFFLVVPRSGRYTVRPERGAGAMRRDERGNALAQLSARNGFIVVMVGLAAVGVAYGVVLERAVPAAALGLLVALGWAAYFISDLWLRRS